MSELPPQNPDAERAVLGAMLSSGEIASQAVDLLAAEDFYDQGCRVLFETCRGLAAAGTAVDVITVCAALRQGGHGDRVVLAQTVLSDVSTLENWRHHAEIVLDYAQRRRDHAVKVEIGEHLGNGGVDTETRQRLLGQLASVREATSPEAVTVPLGEFIAVEEAGAGSLLGRTGEAVIPEDGDVMVYGDGGAGKTTLTIDAAFHLAAGAGWLGIPVSRPVNVLLIECEGPRPLLRAKLRSKQESWSGPPIGERIHVLEAPWASFTFSDLRGRAWLAAEIQRLAIDVVIVGPVSRVGMNSAGTLQEVRDFMALVSDVRQQSERPVAVVLIHHENKGGTVSGAWEGAGDTLMHVQGRGHGRTRLFFQKARWASSYHGTALELVWTDGEGFAVDEQDGLTDEMVADKIMVAIEAHPGTGWTAVEKQTPGVNAERRRDVRDALFARGVIVNKTKDGQLLRECLDRKPCHLYLATDPTLSDLRLEPDADGTQVASAWGATGSMHLRPASRLKGTQEQTQAVRTPRAHEGQA